MALLAALGPGDAAGRSESPRLHRLPPAAQAAPEGWTGLPVAVLRGLDKSSGLVSTFEVAVGSVAPFGRLEITVNACRVPPAGEDAAAHLAILDRKGQGTLVFSGWMVASSPAVSALDHPRYDVWTLACSTASASPS